MEHSASIYFYIYIHVYIMWRFSIINMLINSRALTASQQSIMGDEHNKQTTFHRHLFPNFSFQDTKCERVHERGFCCSFMFEHFCLLISLFLFQLVFSLNHQHISLFFFSFFSSLNAVSCLYSWVFCVFFFFIHTVIPVLHLCFVCVI